MGPIVIDYHVNTIVMNLIGIKTLIET